MFLSAKIPSSSVVDLLKKKKIFFLEPVEFLPSFLPLPLPIVPIATEG